MIVSVIFLIISALISIVGILYIIRSLIKTITKEAPFVPSPHETARMLTQYITLTESDVVYDIGCGDGRLLQALHKEFPSSTYIGVEYAFAPYLLFHLYNRNIKGEKFRIMRKNFFKQDFSNATYILTYLFPHIMDKLLPKLQKELKPGTQLISIDFAFSNKKPDQVITLPNKQKNRRVRGVELYVYKF